jgi:hypothetical protein
MKKRNTPKQIVGKLRQADGELDKGQTVPQVRAAVKFAIRDVALVVMIAALTSCPDRAYH